jgi:hypothetical protein
MPLLLNILRLLVGVFGFCLVYLAVFTYEGTDRRIQNWMEDLWLRFAYDARTPTGVAKGLARVVLSLMNKILDRVFGAIQLSIRTLSVALCYAYGALLLSFIPLSLFARLARIDFDPFLKNLPLTAGGRAQMIVAAVVFLIGTIPAVHPSLRWVTYLAAFWILASCALVTWAVMTGRPEVTAVASSIDDPGGLLVALWVALVCGIGVVHAIRYSVHKSVKADATRRDLVIVSSILMIPFVAFSTLALVAVIVSRPRGHLTLRLSSLLSRKGVMFLLFSLGGPNSVWGFGFFIAVALTLLVLLHLTMWPVIRFFLMKMLYAAQRHELITGKVRLWSTGLGFVACATVPGELWKLFITIISKMR